jgi:lysozyme family protein
MSDSKAFIDALELTLRHEGGYVHHPADPGGETNFGITVGVARRHGYQGPMRDLPIDTARAIYRLDYWLPIRGDELPPAIAAQVFDCAVNCGVGPAVRMLQRALGVADDGDFGPVTLAASWKIVPQVFRARYAAERLGYYSRLSGFATFGRGWVNRVAAMLNA